MINWEKIGTEDMLVIKKIASRAVKLMPQADKMSIDMDITAAHIASPLRLADLLDADRFNFLHDICGINRHIDRDTGEMTDCFSPRFSTRG